MPEKIVSFCFVVFSWKFITFFVERFLKDGACSNKNFVYLEAKRYEFLCDLKNEKWNCQKDCFWLQDSKKTF